MMISLGVLYCYCFLEIKSSLNHNQFLQLPFVMANWDAFMCRLVLIFSFCLEISDNDEDCLHVFVVVVDDWIGKNKRN